MTMKLNTLKKTRKIHPIMTKLPLGSKYTLKEPVSSLSHFVGAIGAIIALFSLAFVSTSRLTGLELSAFVIYCLSMFAVFFASALYHGFPTTIRGQKLLNKLDHSMIYVFIAGSYVPIFLVATPQSIGVPIIAAVSAIAIIGVYLELFGKQKNRKWGALTYVLMGWVGIFGFKSLMTHLPSNAVWLIVTGGILYTIGALFYAAKRPNPFPKVFGFHEIFHFFVLAGTVCHFWVVWFVILPLALNSPG